MPGMYADGEYDIAGFTTGVVEKSKLIDGTKVKIGDVLVGIASTGVHSNGFSLVRKIFTDSGLDLYEVYPELDGSVSVDGDPAKPRANGQPLGLIALTPTRIYVKQVLDVIRQCDVHGVAHMTGGGFDENLPRILREGQGVEVKEGSWEILPIFRFLEKHGRIDHREMFNIFNMGVGMVLVLDVSEAEKAIDILASYGDRATVIGRVTGEPGVHIH